MAKGSCIPVHGTPENGRPACDAAKGDPCTAATCDGITATSCKGFALDTPCRAASCTNGTATLAASCVGKGACPAVVTQACTPYACGATACKNSCQADADCDAKFRCDVAKHACVARDASSCDGDHTLLDPSGAKSDCAPYKCSGTMCKTTCTSVLDCVSPSECDPDTHTCAPPPPAPTSQESGCAAAGANAPARTRDGAWLGVVPLLNRLARRTRRRAAR
jgi:hypothetical protein